MSSQFKMLRVIIQTSSIFKMTKESEFREYIDRLLLTKDFYVAVVVVVLGVSTMTEDATELFLYQILGPKGNSKQKGPIYKDYA